MLCTLTRDKNIHQELCNIMNCPLHDSATEALPTHVQLRNFLAQLLHIPIITRTPQTHQPASKRSYPTKLYSYTPAVVELSCGITYAQTDADYRYTPPPLNVVDGRGYNYVHIYVQTADVSVNRS